MAIKETSTVDATPEIIHDHIRKLADAIYAKSGVKLEDVRINWYDVGFDDSIIANIKIETTKRN
jgi:hypothetical protein